MAEPRPFPPSPRRLALARASGLTSASPLLVGAAATVAVVGAMFTLGAAASARLGGWIASACAGADGARVGATSAGTGAARGGATHVGATSANVDAHVGASADAANATLTDVGATSANVDAHVGATAPSADAANATLTDVGVSSPGSDAAALPFADAATAVLELALPLIAAAAIAALLVHLAQTRGLWLPRRTLPGAPRIPRDAVARTALDIVGALAIGAVCLGWLWTTAPQLALLVQSPRPAAAALASLLGALAIAWVALGVIDALVRHVQLGSALAMTRDEKREDDRLAAADPRWRAQRLSIMRGNTSDAVARSTIVLLGDDLAIAVAWDPVRQPVPLRVATGRRARATQLVALARRHHVAVHRDRELAARLVDHEGPVPESDWPRLAPIIAAVRR